MKRATEIFNKVAYGFGNATIGFCTLAFLTTCLGLGGAMGMGHFGYDAAAQTTANIANASLWAGGLTFVPAVLGGLFILYRDRKDNEALGQFIKANPILSADSSGVREGRFDPRLEALLAEQRARCPQSAAATVEKGTATPVPERKLRLGGTS